MIKFLKFFVGLLLMSGSLSAIAQIPLRPRTTEELKKYIGRDDAIWYPTLLDNPVSFYFQTDGTGARITQRKDKDMLVEKFKWNTISPFEVTLKFQKKLKLDTLQFKNCAVHEFKLGKGYFDYYTAKYTNEKAAIMLAEMILHPFSIKEDVDEISQYQIKSHIENLYDECKVTNYSSYYVGFDTDRRCPVIIGDMKFTISTFSINNNQRYDEREFSYHVSSIDNSKSGEIIAEDIKRLLVGDSDGFIRDEGLESDIAIFGMTGNGYLIKVRLRSFDSSLLINVTYRKEKDRPLTQEDIRLQQRLEEAERYLRETEETLNRLLDKAKNEYSAPSGNQNTNIIIVPSILQTQPRQATNYTGYHRHCTACYGTGVCQTCGGDGIVSSAYGGNYECINCKNGKPRSEWGKCAVCHGTGKLGKIR